MRIPRLGAAWVLLLVAFGASYAQEPESSVRAKLKKTTQIRVSKDNPHRFDIEVKNDGAISIYCEPEPYTTRIKISVKNGKGRDAVDRKASEGDFSNQVWCVVKAGARLKVEIGSAENKTLSLALAVVRCPETEQTTALAAEIKTGIATALKEEKSGKVKACRAILRALYKQIKENPDSLRSRVLSRQVFRLSTELYWQNDYRRSLPLARQRVDFRTWAHGKNHPSVLWSRKGIIRNLKQMGRTKKAAKEADEVIELWETIFSEDHEDVLDAVEQRASIAYDASDHEVIIKTTGQLLKYWAGTKKPGDLSLFSYWRAASLNTLGRLKMARQEIHRTSKFQNAAAAGEGLGLSAIYYMEGRINRALKDYEAAATSFEKSLQFSRQDPLSPINGLALRLEVARFYELRGESTKLRKLLDEIVPTLEKSPLKTVSGIHKHWGDVGSLYTVCGEFPRGASCLATGISIATAILPPGDSWLIDGRLLLALAYQKIKEDALALEQYAAIANALENLPARRGRQDEDFYEGYCRLLSRVGRKTPCLEIGGKWLECCEIRLKGQALPLAEKQGFVAGLYFDCNALQAALDLADLSLRELPKDQGDEHRITVEILSVNCLRLLGKLESAYYRERKLIARLAADPKHQKSLNTVLGNHAHTLHLMGRHSEAIAVDRSLLTVFESQLEEQDTRILESVLLCVGRLGLTNADAYALPILERLAELWEEAPPETVALRELLWILHASALRSVGDRDRPQVLYERAYRSRLKRLPSDSSELDVARSSFGVSLIEAGREKEALGLFEKSLAATLKRSSATDIYPMGLQNNIAGILDTLGRTDEALKRLKENIELCRRKGVAPAIRTPMEILYFDILRRNGKVERALAGLPSLIEELESEDIPNEQEITRLRFDLLDALHRKQQSSRARPILTQALDSILKDIARQERISTPRELAGNAAAQSQGLDGALSLGLAYEDPALDAELMTVIETLRGVELTSPLALREAGKDPARRAKIEPLRYNLSRLSRELDHLVSQGSGSTPAFNQCLAQKELAERRLLGAINEIPEVQSLFGAATPKRIAAALDSKQVAIGFRRYQKTTYRQNNGQSTVTHDMAFVLDSRGQITRVELGPATKTDEAIADYRRSMGLSVPARGIEITNSVKDRDPITYGRRLRELLLDPILAVIGDAKHLIVAMDNAHAQVPLDALPTSGKQILGDKFTISRVLRLRDLDRSEPRRPDGPMLVIGGVDYGTPLLAQDLNDDGEPKTRVRRSLAFASLPGALRESKDIAELTRAAKGKDFKITVREAESATAAAFLHDAPNYAYLHVATHGWLRPQVRQNSSANSKILSESEVSRTLSPLSLSGLAFAGANQSEAGLLSAAEIASLDLHRCELCVLSACETSLGQQRLYRSTASLLLGLQSAGVRHCITSLWKVPDEATRQLMGIFYRELWKGQSKAAALWTAKSELRKTEGPAAWAGWILTGPIEN